MTTEPPALAVTDFSTGYGPMEVVHGVSLEVGTGELVALVGRNGAGKSTLLAAVAGVRRGPTSGRVALDGEDVSGLRPAAVFVRGLALVPEGHRLFTSMSVEENLRLGAFPWRRGDRRRVDDGLSRAYDLFPDLSRAARRAAGDLSGGQQQMLAVAQALMASPNVLLLDEPSSGLAPAVVDRIYEAMFRLRDTGHALLVVEQDLERALRSSVRTYVMDRGAIAVAGPSTALLDDERVPAIVRGTAAFDHDQ